MHLRDFDLNEIDKGQQMQLCFNVFPRGMTILHKLAYQPRTEDGTLKTN